MRNAVIATLFLSVLVACKFTPNNILDEKKMVAVLTDIHIAEGRLKTVGIFGDSAKKMAPVLYQQLYTQHQLTAQQFQQSYQYYQSNPKKLEKIMDLVIIELSKQESGIK